MKNNNFCPGFLPKTINILAYLLMLLIPLLVSKGFHRWFFDPKKMAFDMIGPVFLALCLIYLCAKPKEKMWRTYLLPFVFCGLILVSAMFSSERAFSLLTARSRIVILLSGLSTGYFCSRSRDSLQKMVMIIGGITAFTSVYTIMQFFHLDVFGLMPKTTNVVVDASRMMTATLGNPDYVGGFLLILSFWMLFAVHLFQKKTIWYALWFISIVALFLCQARSTYLGLFFGILYMLYTRFKYASNVRFQWKYILGGTALIMGIGASLIYLRYDQFGHAFLLRMKDAFLLLESSFQMRMLHWQMTTQMFFQNWKLGLSPGLYKVRYLDYLLNYMKEPDAQYFANIIYASKGKVAGEAHNDFLQIFAENGLFAGASFLLIWVYTFYISRPIRLCTSLRPPVILLRALLIAVLVHACFSFPFHLYVRTFYLWLTVGALSAIILDRNGQIPEDTD